MNKIIKIVFFTVLILALGFFLKGLFMHSDMVMDDMATISTDDKKISYWVAPMDANYRRDKPGKSPMGMALVPVYEDDGMENDNTVKISPAMMNNLGVRTAKVQKGGFQRQIETVGYVDYDENTRGHVHSRTEGWIEKIYVHSVGERIKKGDVIFELYAPELVNAQEEFIQSLTSSSAAYRRATEGRMQSLGLSDTQISNLKKTQKPERLVKFYAPHDGVITMLNAVHGMYVKPDTMIIETADLDSAWLLVDVFEGQSGWVETGLSATVQFKSAPERTWQGLITYIYPYVDPMTRTLKARLEFDNPSEILKPDMYANVTIYGAEKTGVLSVAKEAVIRTGDSERVILALDDGRFQPAKVTTGIESGGRIEILNGVSEGETIVTSAQFLIDSEASFSGTTLRMEGMDSMADPKMKMDSDMSSDMDMEKMQ